MSGPRVVVLAYDGVDELDLFGAYVPLSKAQLYCALTAAIASDHLLVQGSNGVGVVAHTDLEFTAHATAVVVPGGRGVTEAARNVHYIEAVRAASVAGAGLYSVCSGAFLLAAAGLTRGRAIAVHSAKRADLAAAGECRPARSRMVRDGNVCSIGGQLSRGVKGVDIGFQVIRDIAPGILQEVMHRLEVEVPLPPRTT